MDLLKQIAAFTDIILISILMLFMILDSVLILLIKTRRPLLDDEYFDFHRRHGFLKVTVFKLIAALIIIYWLLTHQPNSGASSAPIITHAIFVARLLFKFIRNDRQEKSAIN